MLMAYLSRLARIAFVAVSMVALVAPSAKAGALARTLERTWVAAGAVAIGGYLASRAVQCSQDSAKCPGEQRLRDRIVNGLAKAIDANPGYRI
ncbi:hypothetical protein [Bradyrhizobium betae]|uniref:Uncharacterized protein n=2 Tax=Bradyrhizobium TaxID=374 RepID=A0A5P6P9S3_9BRAD|nr:hypothetical protein [Bradyrhizobium betae]MCS3727301.1 hypothetical protein [Bradyrhizobium betae]QFI74798.1 hypothetical protein F8237_21745 [Bradyrhizobium betae]